MKHIIGNVLNPVDANEFVIAHVCNDQGVMGGGVAKAIALLWPEVAQEYAAFVRQHRQQAVRVLGMTTYTTVHLPDGRRGVVANMICQTLHLHRFPLHMPYLEDCLESVKNFAFGRSITVHVPRIGCGLARGHWEDISQLIPPAWNVYTLPEELELFPIEAYYHIAPEFQARFNGRFGLARTEIEF